MLEFVKHARHCHSLLLGAVLDIDSHARYCHAERRCGTAMLSVTTPQLTMPHTTMTRANTYQNAMTNAIMEHAKRCRVTKNHAKG